MNVAGKASSKRAVPFLLLLVSLVLTVSRTLAGTTTLYDSGFCFPGLTNAALIGQGGWENDLSYSFDAAQVVSCPVGKMVELFGPFVEEGSPNFYNSEVIQPLSNYDPVASGTPIVSVRAETCMNLGPATGAANYVFAFLVLNDQNGTPFETIGIDKNGVVFGQNFNSPNQVVTAPNNGTNGFHILRADLNFSTRQVTFYMDGSAMGSMPFNPSSSTQIGSVALVLQSSNPIDSNFFADDVTVTAASAEIPTGGCALSITGAGTCLSDGTPGTPNVGDLYGLYVNYNVTGTPYQPFRIKFTIGNVVWYSDDQIVTAGHWTFDFFWWVSLDGTMPWSITLDPDGVSGSTNLANMTASGTFTPTPPTVPLQLYNQVTVCGTQEPHFSYQTGSGTLYYQHIVFGSPTSHGGQQVLSVTGPSNVASTITAPYGVPVFVVNYTNVPAGVFQPSESFIAQLSSMRVNPALMETNTWAGMSALPTNITQWLAPDRMCQSTSPAISNFDNLYLPASYKTTMTPYETARALQKAVARCLVYTEPPPYADATNSLQAGAGDCGCYAALLTAALRCAGIPARRIAGFWESDTWANYPNWHVRTESYFPNTGWVITDSCEENNADPTGLYSWDFCFTPDANFFFAMDVGDQHILPYYNFNDLEAPGWWWDGSATFLSDTADTYLQPRCVVTPVNLAGTSCNFTITNLPFAGTVSLLGSTNLVDWSTLSTTNAADISSISLDYSFSMKNKPVRFFRSVQSP
jgi:hypothetical protein